MTRSQPLAPDERRAQLLEAARSVFVERGYYRTSVSDIVSAAGVARGTFYNYFDSKRAVFQASLDAVMEQVNDAVIPIDVASPIPPQVTANLQRLIVTLSAPEVSRLLFAEAVGIDDEGDEALRAFYADATERVERALTTGQEMGIVRDGDMVLTAQMLMGVLKQPIFQGTLTDNPPDPAVFVQEFYRLLAGGVLR